MHENCGNAAWVRWEVIGGYCQVTSVWQLKRARVDSISEIIPFPHFFLSPSVRATRKQYKEICHVRVFAPCKGMNIYIVTRYTSLPTRLSVVRAIGPINRSNDVLVRTCHEKNKSETCFAFFLTAVMAVLSNLWMPRLLLQGQKPKRRKQNNLYNILVWNQWKERRLLLWFFFFNDVYIIFITIKETIKMYTTLYLYFNLIK